VTTFTKEETSSTYQKLHEFYDTSRAIEIAQQLSGKVGSDATAAVEFELRESATVATANMLLQRYSE
jgi:hypothetical protein